MAALDDRPAGERPGRRRWLSRGVAETEALGAMLAAELLPSGVLLLSGDLGSGKTVLARGVASALGIAPREVQSPTFNLIREHHGAGGQLLHVDLYRLDATSAARLAGEVAALGLEELLAGTETAGIKVVEWAERLPFAVPGAMRLRLRRLERAAGDERAEREIDGDWPGWAIASQT